MRTKDIIKDKFLGPFFFLFLYCLFYFDSADGWFLSFLALTISIILFVIFRFRKDFYMHNYFLEKETFTINYQKNFYKNEILTCILKPESVSSFSFQTNKFPYTIYGVSIKFLDDDGLYDKITFKIKNDDMFINFISDLNKVKKHIPNQ